MKSGEKTDRPIITAIVLLTVGALAVSGAISYVYFTHSSSSLPDNAGNRGSGFYTTYYGTFEAIDSVLERNEYMILHPVSLSREDSLWYVTASDGTDSGNAGNAESGGMVLEEISALSDEICRGIDSDYDKAYALSVWVGENIAYDFDSEDIGSDRSVICLETVMEKRRTTCGGFANLYSALCSAQGLYCLCLRGGAVSEGFTRAGLEDIPANHCWNAVAADGQWYYADCTWISDLSYSEDRLIPAAENRKFYALMGFGEMSIEHRIDRCEHRDFGF